MTKGRWKYRFAVADCPEPSQALCVHRRESVFERCRPLSDLASKAMTAFLTGAVRLYQLTLRPYIGGQCRFHPTCSDYALEVLENHGPLRGSWWALKRLLKCHPFHPGGFDQPPPRRT